MRLTTLAALCILGITIPCEAARVSFSAGPDPQQCPAVATQPGSTIDLYLFLDAGPGGVSAIQFRLVPASPALTLVEWNSLNGFLAVGDPGTGVAIALATCLTGSDIGLLRVRYLVTGEIDCSEIDIRPHPDAPTGDVEVYDCHFDPERATIGGRAFVTTQGPVCDGYSPPPRDPVPAHGATSVPVTLANVAWDIDAPHAACPPLGNLDLRELYFGTDPDPPLFPQPWLGIGPLEPSTTYYWRVVIDNYGYTAESPVWSFTTENETAVERSTWGRVKALFR